MRTYYNALHYNIIANILKKVISQRLFNNKDSFTAFNTSIRSTILQISSYIFVICNIYLPQSKNSAQHPHSQYPPLHFHIKRHPKLTVYYYNTFYTSSATRNLESWHFLLLYTQTAGQFTIIYYTKKQYCATINDYCTVYFTTTTR